MLQQIICPVFLCMLLLAPGLAAEETAPLTEALVQQAFGPASGLIPLVEKAPVIDGQPYEEAWKGVPVRRLGYADPDIAGPAKFGGDVKVIADRENLYISFMGRVKSPPKGPERPTDDPKILEDNYFAVYLVNGQGQVQSGIFIAVNPSGSLHHADIAHEKGIPVLNPKWNPKVVEAISKVQFGWWTIEMNIGLQDLDAKLREGSFWGVNFLRSNAVGPVPKNPERDERNAYMAWVPDPKLWNPTPLHAFGMFGHPKAVKSKAFLMRVARARSDLQPPAPAREPLAGFEFTQAELEKIYPGAPVCLVPVVAQPPAVDGDGSDEAWKKVPTATLGFLDGELEGLPEMNRTHVRLVSDKEHLYALFECDERQMEKVVAGDGALWAQDVIDLLLDVGRSFDTGGGSYFMLEANSKGRAATNRGDGFHWKPKGFQAAAKSGKERWTVELKIAFADLGIAADNFPKIFGANFMRSRAIHRSDTEGDPMLANTEFAWRSNLLDTPHVLDNFGVLYLQAGNALPEELLANLKARGQDAAKLGLKSYVQPAAQAQDVAALPKRVAKFKRAPAVEVQDGKAAIAFEVEAPVDVAVAILNAQGRTVRHLAAGQLGPKAPPPFTSGVNVQRLLWDFTDDYGKPVPQGEYKASVALGLKADFERVLIGDSHRMSNVMGLTVDREGVVYVLQEDSGPAHYRIANILAYNRAGKFVRHVLPFPGRLSLEHASATGALANPDGGWLPVVYQALLHSFIPQFGTLRMQRPVITKGGKLVLTNNVDEIRMRVPKRLFLVGTDGRIEPGFLGPLLGAEPFRGKAAMALSPDERWLYVTGLSGRGQWIGSPPHHSVYRLDLQGQPAPLEADYAPVWLGERFVPGAGATRFNDPNGIAVDAQGNVHVADTGNHRIAVFTADGKFVREWKVEAPDQIEIHPKSGARYVLSLGAKTQRILKFDADGKELAALSAPRDPKVPTILALDPVAEPAVLWFIAQRRSVHKVVEKDGAFQNLGDVIFAQGDPAKDLTRQNNLQNFELVDDGKKIYIYGLRYDAQTGKHLPEEKSAPLARGRDGRLYHFVPKHELRRFTADGKPDPFPKGVKGSEPGLEGVLPAQRCYYYTVDRDGNVYTLSDQLDKNIGPAAHKYRSDGSLEKAGFIQLPLPAKSSGPVATLECGPDGCFYLACNIKKPGHTVPPLFPNRLPVFHGDRMLEGAVYPGPQMFYEHFYGSVAKFGPEGGRITYDEAGEWLVGSNYGGIHPAKIEGIRWAHLGISPLVYRNRDHARCTCEHASFGMDGFGRLFIPDAFQARVEVIDANANVLTRFGRYGNQDARGPGSPVGEPEIGFAWPVRVRVHEDACFVADRINHRILRLKLSYLEEQAAGFRAP